MNGSEEKKLSFSFSKVKKTNIVQTESTLAKQAFSVTQLGKRKVLNGDSDGDENSDSDANQNDKLDLITVIEEKKVKSIKSIKEEEKNKPLVIPLTSNVNTEDLRAIQALIADAKKNSEEVTVRPVNPNLKIELNEKQDAVKQDEASNTEDPNYEQINIEDFGLACLRGMGWKETEGIGKTNKQAIEMKLPELRPRGLGLGAGSSLSGKNKKIKVDHNDKELQYVKNAYLKIISGKHMNEYAQLVSFDDGLNRILVKLASDNQTISILQTGTELVTRKEYEKKS